jgi:hypothetical protein
MSLRSALISFLLALSHAQPNDSCCNITAEGVLKTCAQCALISDWDQYTLNSMNITAVDVDAFNFPGGDKDLHLMNNLITTLPDGVFRNLKSARLMDLSWNAIESLSDNVFEGLSSLEELDLSVNRIASVSPLAFRSTPALQTLNLENQFFPNYTSGDGWVLRNGTFSACANLTDLTLFTTALLSVEVGAFKGLSSLKSLDISNGFPPNNIFPPFPDFSGSPALQDLDMNGVLCGGDTPASTLPASFLKGLAALVNVDLTDNSCIITLPRGLFADQSPSFKPMISDKQNNCNGGLPASCKACGVEVAKLDASCFS